MKRIPGQQSNRFVVWSQRIALYALIVAPLICGPLGVSQSSTSARLSGSVTDTSPGGFAPTATGTTGSG